MPHLLGLCKQVWIASSVIKRHHEPATPFQFLFQLAGGPACIAAVNTVGGFLLGDHLLQVIFLAGEVDAWKDTGSSPLTSQLEPEDFLFDATSYSGTVYDWKLTADTRGCENISTGDLQSNKSTKALDASFFNRINAVETLALRAGETDSWQKNLLNQAAPGVQLCAHESSNFWRKTE